jgi:hypothetical protein
MPGARSISHQGKNCESSSLTRKLDATLGLPALNGTPPLPKSS